jgi:hypothetical protein
MVKTYVLRISPGLPDQADIQLVNGHTPYTILDAPPGGVVFGEPSSSTIVATLLNTPIGVEPPFGKLAVYEPGAVPLPPDGIAYTVLGGESIEEIGNRIRETFMLTIEQAKGVPTQYDNGPDIDPGQALWAYVAVDIGVGDTLDTTGDGRSEQSRMTGTLRVEFRDKLNRGDGDIWKCIDDVDKAFRWLVDDKIRYGGPYPRIVGVEPAGSTTISSARTSAYWRVDIIIPFRIDRPDLV